MNKTEKFESAIAHYKALLPCERFVVTGGFVLFMHGLYPETKDLDIILVNPTEEAKTILQRIQTELPAKKKPNGKSDLIAKIQHDPDFSIDFFEAKKAPNLFSGDRYCSATVSHIIEAKEKANRLKDWVQLRRIAEKICNQAKYTSVILTAPIGDESY